MRTDQQSLEAAFSRSHTHTQERERSRESERESETHKRYDSFCKSRSGVEVAAAQLKQREETFGIWHLGKEEKLVVKKSVEVPTQNTQYHTRSTHITKARGKEFGNISYIKDHAPPGAQSVM